MGWGIDGAGSAGTAANFWTADDTADRLFGGLGPADAGNDWTGGTGLAGRLDGFLFSRFTPALPEGDTVLRKVGVDPSLTRAFTIDGVQGDPLRWGMQAIDLNSPANAIEHAFFGRTDSRWLSASELPLGAPDFKGTPFIIDRGALDTAHRGLTHAELMDEARAWRAAAIGNQDIFDESMRLIHQVEAEALLRDFVPPQAIRSPSPLHAQAIAFAEDAWEAERLRSFDATGLSTLASRQMQDELVAARATELTDALRTNDRWGHALNLGFKSLGVLGTAASAYDLVQAGRQSWQTGDPGYFSGEAARQSGGWAGGWAGGAVASSLLADLAPLGISAGPWGVVGVAAAAGLGGWLGETAIGSAIDRAPQWLSTPMIQLDLGNTYGDQVYTF